MHVPPCHDSILELVDHERHAKSRFGSSPSWGKRGKCAIFELRSLSGRGERACCEPTLKASPLWRRRFGFRREKVVGISTGYSAGRWLTSHIIFKSEHELAHWLQRHQERRREPVRILSANALWTSVTSSVPAQVRRRIAPKVFRGTFHRRWPGARVTLHCAGVAYTTLTSETPYDHARTAFALDLYSRLQPT